MLPPQGSEQLAQAAVEQLWFVYVPLSEPLLQVRGWSTEVQLLPQGTELVEYAVTLALWAMLPPHGSEQLAQAVTLQLWLL